MHTGRALAFVVFVSWLPSFRSFAVEPTPAEAGAPSPREATGAPTEKGLVVFVDPATGKTRQPDAAEIGGLLALPAGPRAVSPPADAPLVMKTGAGGAVGIVLDSRFESFVVVTKTPDGSLAMDCVTGARTADETVLAAAKPGSKPPRKVAPRVR